MEPQITIELLTDAYGSPLMEETFEGNRAETTTLIPSIQTFQAAHALGEVTVIADAGTLSDGNLRALFRPDCATSLVRRFPTSPMLRGSG